jgi:hypothetical protein
MTIRSFSLLLLTLSPATFVACSGDSAGTTGALGQSSTRPDCAPEDSACQSDGLDAPLAIGARLPLDTRITARGVAAPKMTLESARTGVLGVEGVTLIGKSAGWSSVMMINEGGLVLDFVTMTVAAPDRMELYRLTDSGAVEAAPMPTKIQLAVGDDFEVSVKPWSGATRLLGNIDAVWTLSDPSIATLLDGGRPSSRRVRVKAVGSATLTIEPPKIEPTPAPVASTSTETKPPDPAAAATAAPPPFAFKKTLEVEVLP